MTAAAEQELVSLREATDRWAPEDTVPGDGFDALLDGRRVLVTAVLERTAVCADPTGRQEKVLARWERVIVLDPRQLRWLPGPKSKFNTAGKPPDRAETNRRRQQSDSRAQADQRRERRRRRLTAPPPNKPPATVGESAPDSATTAAEAIPLPHSPAPLTVPPPPPSPPPAPRRPLSPRVLELTDLLERTWDVIAELEAELAPYRVELPRLARRFGVEVEEPEHHEKPRTAASVRGLVGQLLAAWSIGHDLGEELMDYRYEARRLALRLDDLLLAG